MALGRKVLETGESFQLKEVQYPYIARVKLHLKLRFCHEGTKTQRDDIYFNLGALETLWQNEHHQSFYFDQTGRLRPAAGLNTDT